MCLVSNVFRDAWSLGALDPSSGTATLLEITRVLGQMYKNGTFPSFYLDDLIIDLYLYNRISTTTQPNVLFVGC